MVWPYLAAGFVLAALLIRPLDRLALGDDVAASLGARPRLIRLGAGVAAALLAAGAAALAGLLGFLGLIVAHVVRLAGGTASHAFVVPASAVGGCRAAGGGGHPGAHRACARSSSRGAADGGLGVPLFLWLLRKAV